MPRFNANAIETLSRLIPLLSIILTAVLSLAPFLSGLSSGNPGEPVGVTEERMRTDLLTGIQYQRGFAGPELDLERHAAAQTWAERNAASGSEENSPEDIAMVQAHLPSNEADAGAFLGLWMGSQPHAAVLLDPDNTRVGIGVASNNGITYAVVQFTRE
ncbi:CAP domain-containing protein [Corynebacterium pacaense]|uniref:CAP domain-containing protein n=1 Tax=Corynebacterium pacaense TaxID=1816684 RepID=UPI0009BA08B5|nr:CAP domain-containing protein [Corynebacterium pacaense]